MTNTILNEPENIDWVVPGCHEIFITNHKEGEPSKNHAPADMAKWSEEALNLMAQVDLSTNEPLNLKLTVNTVPIKSLLPLQSRIRITKTILDQLTNKWNAAEMTLTQNKLCTKSGPFPILTCAQKYIIDGHHRWAQYLITNPTAYVEIIDVSPYRKGNHISYYQKFYEDFDSTLSFLLVENGHLSLLSDEEYTSKETKKNSLRMSFEEVEQFVRANITNQYIELLLDHKKTQDGNQQTAISYVLNNIKYFASFV